MHDISLVRLEAKYGGALARGSTDDSREGPESVSPAKKRQKSNDEDMYDLEDDSFIDDSELVAQIEQRDESAATRTKHGGFFVSTGELKVQSPSKALKPLPPRLVVKDAPVIVSKGSKQQGSSAAKKEAKAEALRRDAKQKASATEEHERACFSHLSSLVATQCGITDWEARWRAWEEASAAGTAPDSEEQPSKGPKQPPLFLWTHAVSRALLAAATAKDDAREARKAMKATMKGLPQGEELSVKAEKEIFLAAVSALWPRGSMPPKKINAKLGAERKRQGGLASEAALAAAAAYPVTNATSSGSKAKQSVDVAVAPQQQQQQQQQQQHLLKGTIFPEVQFSDIELVIGGKCVLPRFDYT